MYKHVCVWFEVDSSYPVCCTRGTRLKLPPQSSNLNVDHIPRENTQLAAYCLIKLQFSGRKTHALA